MQDASPRPERPPGSGSTARPGRPLEPVPSAAQLRTLLAALTAAVTVIAAINLTPLMDSWSVRRLLDLNGELTLASWLSSAMLLGIGAAAALLALYESALGRTARRSRGWWAMAALFVALSADEAAMLHELVGLVVSAQVSEIPNLPGVFAWVVVLTPVGLAVAALVFRWLRDTVGWRGAHGRMGLAALGLWLSVPILEVLDPRLGGPTWLHVLEESAELGGEILMLGCLLGTLRELQLHHPLAVVDAADEVGGLDFSHAPPPSSQGRDRGARPSASGPRIGPSRDPRGDLAGERDRAPELTP